MKIAVLSGKGGAGKTFVSTNLAVNYDNACYIDCDVEEPNGRLFFNPVDTKVIDVSTPIPIFDKMKCNGCRKCVDFCKFNALIYIKDEPMLFSEVCHACGGCELVCPNGAITQNKRDIGKIEIGTHKDLTIITGILNIGESSGIKIIEKAQEIGFNTSNNIIIDCPPGSACSVMESILNADYCVIVVEPTIFGLHNFKMVYELTKILKKPCGIIINKYESNYEPLDNYCKANNIEILAKIPFSSDIASLIASGKIASYYDQTTKSTFKEIIQKIENNSGGVSS